jgi:Ser/Thr protein kinase RdoA (MazF antagonist)
VHIRGDVVCRPRKSWTPTVQSLLQHLHGSGLPVPEPLGYDEELEYVRLIEGDAGDDAWPHQLELPGIRSAGALLRDLHDATVDWRPPADAEWSVPSEGTQVVCHGDPQPGNFAWRDGRVVGLFDWDAARPAARLSDVAYALLWFAPFNADDKNVRLRGFVGVPNRRARAEALLEGYGWVEQIDIAQAAIARHVQAIDEVVLLGERGHEPHAGWVADGWPELWRAEVAELSDVSLEPPAAWCAAGAGLSD